MVNQNNVSLQHLPTLGLGVSLSLGAEPSPLQMLSSACAPQFIEYAGLADIERIKQHIQPILDANCPVLYHPSYINFCGSFQNSEKWLEVTAEHIHYVKSPWLAQDCAYCFWQDQHGYSTQLGYFIPPIFNEASLQNAIKRIKEIQQIITVPIVVEPPPVVFVAGAMPLLTFFGRLAVEANCLILLDMGHLVSWEMASGNLVLADAHNFPFDRVVEVHIAGGKLQSSAKGSFYIDAHECAILPETYKMLETLLPLLSRLKAVCYECEGIQEKNIITNTLKHLRTLIRTLSSNSTLVEKVEKIL